MIRAVAAIALPGVTPAEISTEPPVMATLSPDQLVIEDRYQRGLSERSVRLIRKIVAEWDWRAFKPPIVVETDGHYEVIDGQHTAIAAITHGGIPHLPVLLIEAEEAARANAFVRHNRDRIQVTPTQLHNAMVAAGDEDALTIEQVCGRAGIRILRNPPNMGRYEPGDTLAITTIRALVNRRYAVGARRVLDVCAACDLTPVSADLIKAVECLLFSPEYKNEIEPGRIPLIVSAMGASLAEETKRFAVERKIQRWRALASMIFMSRRKARHG